MATLHSLRRPTNACVQVADALFWRWNGDKELLCDEEWSVEFYAALGESLLLRNIEILELVELLVGEPHLCKILHDIIAVLN